MARRYWQLLGEPDRTVLVRREKAYHGMHTAGTSLAGIPASRRTRRADRGRPRGPWDERLARAAIERRRRALAAFFCEPVIGSGGVFLPPEGTSRPSGGVPRHRRAVRRDEVITGSSAAATGSPRPGSTSIPTSSSARRDHERLPAARRGARLTEPVAEPFWAEGAGIWRPRPRTAATPPSPPRRSANIDILEREELPARSRSMEGTVARRAEAARRPRPRRRRARRGRPARRGEPALGPRRCRPGLGARSAPRPVRPG